MELFKLLGTIAISGTDDAKKQIDDVSEKTGILGDKLKEAGGKISDFGGKLTAGLTVPLTALGTLAVKSAADIKAANSQFEQTFGEIQATATDAISRVSEDAGILDTRLQGIGTSIYAFAKSSGADSAEAMALMETSLKATADAAAYYDRSLEETSESLMSFLKGNFANDAALGVSCTETTRNAKAMELFGKKFNDLSEIEKQKTLLKMVTDAQELSGAMGQASRESDGFENVMGNLKESARMLASEFGEVLLPKVIALIQKATELLQKFNGMDEGTKKLILTIGGIAIAIGPVLSVVGNLITLFVNLHTLFVTLQPLFTAVGTAIAGISTPVLITIGVITALIAAGVALYKNWDVIKAKALELYGELQKTFGLIRDVITEIMNVVWSNMVSAWENIRISVSTKISAIVSTVSGKFEEVKNSITNKINGAKNAVYNAIETMKSFFKFEWSLPKLKLPHIYINGEWDLKEGKFPSFGVEWYAKGGVLNQPTAFGINGNRLMVGGEAGPEAVAPIEVLQKYIEESVAAQNTGLVEILQKILAAILSNNEEMKDKFMEALEEMRFDINNREFARLVKAVN